MANPVCIKKTRLPAKSKKNTFRPLWTLVKFYKNRIKKRMRYLDVDHASSHHKRLTESSIQIALSSSPSVDAEHRAARTSES